MLIGVGVQPEGLVAAHDDDDGVRAHAWAVSSCGMGWICALGTSSRRPISRAAASAPSLYAMSVASRACALSTAAL